MKVVNVGFVENEMVEMRVIVVVVNVELNVEMYAEETSPAGIPFNTKLPSLHPIPNQSKSIVPTPSLSLL